MMNFPTLLALCVSLFIGPAWAQTTPARYQTGDKEIRRYFKHWLGLCSTPIQLGCEVTTYTGISKTTKKPENILSIAQKSDGKLQMKVEANDGFSTAQIRLSTSEEFEIKFKPNKDNDTGSFRVAADGPQLRSLFAKMHLANSMTIAFTDRRRFYSLRGFRKSLAFLKSRTPLPTAKAPSATTYLSEFWSGEWPHGFTMSQDLEIMLRKDHVTTTLPTISCVLKQGETYHHWNRDRVKASNLQFLTIQQTIPYVAQESATIEVTKEDTRKDQKISILKGDEWTFLAYYGEGYFRMNYRGDVYSANQELASISNPRNDTKTPDKDMYQEWLGMNCNDGNTGWLLFSEISGRSEFSPANFAGYGRALDVKINPK